MRLRTCMPRGAVALAVPLLLLLALGGCGSGGSSSAGSPGSTTVTVGADVPGHAHGDDAHSRTSASRAHGEAIATVDGSPIARSAYEHWLAVTAALSGSDGHSASTSDQTVKDHALGFLISLQWVLGEAAARGIHVSEEAVHKRFAEVQRKQFKKTGELQHYLSTAHETQADLLLRVRLELFEQAIAKQVTAAKHTAAEKKAALTSFQEAFQKKWKALTSCQAGYVMENCREF